MTDFTMVISKDKQSFIMYANSLRAKELYPDAPLVRGIDLLQVERSTLTGILEMTYEIQTENENSCGTHDSSIT